MATTRTIQLHGSLSRVARRVAKHRDVDSISRPSTPFIVKYLSLGIARVLAGARLNRETEKAFSLVRREAEVYIPPSFPTSRVSSPAHLLVRISSLRLVAFFLHRFLSSRAVAAFQAPCSSSSSLFLSLFHSLWFQSHVIVITRPKIRRKAKEIVGEC